MPELAEQMYCSQQIVVPPKFPFILKKYCKAAIKTQPYDLLRWSYEYFAALAAGRAPPVKLRLEYPIYSTEGGLTKGCLKVMLKQLGSIPMVAVRDVRTAWKGFCLDPEELNRILCLCEVYLRADAVPLLHFLAVAGGLLTKTLTHTMILLCETLTIEPDGGSAAVPVQDFLTMYKFLAPMDASKDVKYYNGRKEGTNHTDEETGKEKGDVEKSSHHSEPEKAAEMSDDDFKDWDDYPVRTLLITNDRWSHTTRLSLKLKSPITERVQLSISTEEQENETKAPASVAAEGDEQDEVLATSVTSVLKPGSEDATTPPPSPTAEELECSMTSEASVPEVTQVFYVPGIGGPVDADTMREFQNYALEVSRLQGDLFMPRNIRHFMCPPLENYPEPGNEETFKEDHETASAKGEH